MKDAHDPREFRQYVTLAADGTVAAVHEFASGVEDPLVGVIEVTDLGPRDFSSVKVDVALVPSVVALDVNIDSVEAQNTRILAKAQIRDQVLGLVSEPIIPIGPPVGPPGPPVITMP